MKPDRNADDVAMVDDKLNVFNDSDVYFVTTSLEQGIPSLAQPQPRKKNGE